MIREKKLKFYGIKDLGKIPQLSNISSTDFNAAKVISNVLPFRTNNYVIDELINWNNIPDDPIYQLTFLQKGMLTDEHFNKMEATLKSTTDLKKIKSVANEIRFELNPHPADQLTANVPTENNEPVHGIQHKYRETCLVFPTSSQTCHAYCTFCFRWAQFVGMNDLKFAVHQSKKFQSYLRDNKEITDVLFTGGDPMVMSLQKLEAYILPLLAPEFEHIRSIRIGTKSLSYWPYRFVTDPDADGILKLFEHVTNAGKHLAIMAHVNHWVELSTKVVQEAISRIRETGAQIRTQSPLIKHINDDAEIWSKMWKDQVKLGMIPYYFFVERDTGSMQYFAVPLHRALKIFKDAYSSVSGLCRTVRGPSMSATPGKVVIEGITEIYGEKVFVLNFLQARNPNWVKKPFFAKYDKNAIWLSGLKPALNDDKFFYEDELQSMLEEKLREVGAA